MYRKKRYFNTFIDLFFTSKYSEHGRGISKQTKSFVVFGRSNKKLNIKTIICINKTPLHYNWYINLLY
jgi:hypothetical protein